MFKPEDIGSSEPYADIIREWVKKYPTAPAGYKIVFGGPLGKTEARNAARNYHLYFEGDHVSYSFGQGSNKFDSKPIYETLRLRCIEKASADSLAKTSWDTLPELTVHSAAPEQISFEFDRYNDNQQADSEPIIKRQHEALQEELRKALQQWPGLALVN